MRGRPGTVGIPERGSEEAGPRGSRLGPACDEGAAAPDILLTAFWKAGFCGALIDAAEFAGGIGPCPPDVSNNAAPGQELRIDCIGRQFAQRSEADLRQRLVPVLQTHRWPLKPGRTRMPAFRAARFATSAGGAGPAPRRRPGEPGDAAERGLRRRQADLVRAGIGTTAGWRPARSSPFPAGSATFTGSRR